MTYLRIIENNYSRARVEPFHDNILSRMSMYEISTMLYDFFFTETSNQYSELIKWKIKRISQCGV